MQMFKRIFLFFLVNALVIATITITTSLLGIRPYLSANGINYESLLIFCAIAGFSGALISLFLSRWMAKMMMGVKVINPSNPGSAAERDLLQRVNRLAQKANLPAMPEVGIYHSPEINAFATGPSKRSSLVAVSAGLLNNMDDAAVEGVLAHEIAHIANGDMVTMTLIQGVVNTFVMFFARIAAWGVSNALAGNRDNEERGGGMSYMVQWLLIMVFEILFGILGSVVVATFSRWREYRADNGGARLAGREKMIHALQSLKKTIDYADSGQAPAFQSLKITTKPGGLMALLATHPALDKRIAALRAQPMHG